MKIRRIVVGLDPSAPGRIALETAAALAARTQAELLGLFVEDVDLLHLAGLPFAREVGLASATPRALDVTGMERTLRALAAESERALATVAGRIPVPWSFRIARGSLMAELLAAAAEGDLLLAAMAARSAGGAPLALLCSTGTPPEHVLPAASMLERFFGDGLRIVLLAETAAAAASWERQARALLGERARAAHFRVVPAGDPAALRATLREEVLGVLLVAAPALLSHGRLARALLSELHCPLFVLPAADSAETPLA